MGFPLGYTEVILLPKLFIHILSLLGFVRTSIFALFRFMGMSDFLEPDPQFYQYETRMSDQPPLSAVLTREFLPVVKFEDLPGEAPESCAVCLYEFKKEEEIRCLTNCKHIFHQGCLNRWIDHDRSTCPLCRTPFVPRDLQDEFNKRLWAASGIMDSYSEYSTVPGL